MVSAALLKCIATPEPLRWQAACALLEGACRGQLRLDLVPPAFLGFRTFSEGRRPAWSCNIGALITAYIISGFLIVVIVEYPPKPYSNY